MTQSSPVSFRAPELEPALRQRTHPTGDSVGQVAKRDLARYYDLLRRELESVHFSEPEASLLCDAGNATLWEPFSIPLLWAQVDEAIRLDGLGVKWAVDGSALVTQLRRLTPGQTVAVVDAIERFWTEPEPLADRLRAVGLVR